MIEEYGFEEEGERVSLVESMKGLKWDEIVRYNQLQPTKLKEVRMCWFVDLKFSLVHVHKIFFVLKMC